MNVDTLRTIDSIGSVINNLQTDDIDIACIQETQNNRNGRIGRGNYTVFFSGENDLDKSKPLQNKSIKGGVDIAIKTQLKGNINKIRRYSSRSIVIQLKTTKNTPSMNIINTYTHDVRYDDEETHNHWAETREIMKSIPKNNVI